MKLQWSFFPGSSTTLEKVVAPEATAACIATSRAQAPSLFLTGIEGQLPALWLKRDPLLREKLAQVEDDQLGLLSREDPALTGTPPPNLLIACAGADGALTFQRKDFYDTCGVLYAQRISAAAATAHQPILGRRFFCLDADWPLELAASLLSRVDDRLFQALHPNDVQKLFDDLTSRNRPVATATFASVYGPALKGLFKNRREACGRFKEARLEDDTAAALAHWVMRDFGSVPKGGLHGPLLASLLPWIQKQNRNEALFVGRDPLTGEAAADLGPLPSLSTRLATRSRLRARSQAQAATALLEQSEKQTRSRRPSLSYSAGKVRD